MCQVVFRGFFKIIFSALWIRLQLCKAQPSWHCSQYSFIAHLRTVTGVKDVRFFALQYASTIPKHSVWKR